MDNKVFLNTICYVKDSDIPNDDGQVYHSRMDDSYVTRVGMEDNGLIDYFIEHGIKQLFSNNGNTACYGFSEKEQKWYGWSHRAIYGFEIGSEVKKGDCAYVPYDKDDFLEDMVRFWNDEYRGNFDWRLVRRRRIELRCFNIYQPSSFFKLSPQFVLF